MGILITVAMLSIPLSLKLVRKKKQLRKMTLIMHPMPSKS